MRKLQIINWDERQVSKRQHCLHIAPGSKRDTLSQFSGTITQVCRVNDHFAIKLGRYDVSGECYLIIAIMQSWIPQQVLGLCANGSINS